jgi:hypothetical protein
MRAENSFPAASFGWLSFLGALCVALVLTSFLPPSARALTCPNEAIRAEQGSAALALPGCRAYELVSPGSIPSLTADTKLGMGGGKAAPDGNALSYFSAYPAEGSETSSETWLSRRGATGWNVKAIDPQMTPSPSSNGECLPGVAFSEQLDAHVLSAGGKIELAESPPNPDGECGTPLEELVPGEPRGYSNLYLRRGDSSYLLANPLPAGEGPGNATYQASSVDLSRVVFSEDAQLTPDSPLGHNLFIWADGIVRLVGVLPNGEPVLARLAAATANWGGNGASMGLAPVSHAVSDDGERVFFQANGNLYLRENAGQAPAADANCVTTTEPELACTLHLDRSFGPAPLGEGGGIFQFASRDGARVYFTSDRALTFPSSAQAGRPDLYEYDVENQQIVNLTVAPSGTANVRGISGGSDDGSFLYFVARGVLTGTEQNSHGEVAQLNQPNLYLARDGELTFVATLSPWEENPLGGIDRSNWWEATRGTLRTAWSPSGRYLLFSSFKALTGFDNSPAEPGLCADAEGGPPCQELFLFDAETAGLSCVSCDPSGAKPIAHTTPGERQEFRRFVPGPRYLPRAVLNSGQVFFDTSNPLLPQDVNVDKDVYEYQAGNLSLISSGTGVGGSAFIDASADGRNVFFATPAALVRSDDDGGLLSVYDARVEGGFAEPPLPPAPCAGEGCRPPGPPSPAVSPPSTAAIAGRGNVKPRQCKRGRVRRAGRCVKKGKSQHRKQRSASHRAGGKN